MDKDQWAPPDPAHRMTHETDEDTVKRIRSSWRRQRSITEATARGKHDTRIIVALVLIVVVATIQGSDSSQDITLDDLPAGQLEGGP